MGKSSSYITIDVDVDDIIDDIPEDAILQRAEDIGLPDALVLKLAARISDDKWPRSAALKAINEIRAGRLADAVTTLEREFLPKWQDHDACQSAYNSARAA